MLYRKIFFIIAVPILLLSISLFLPQRTNAGELIDYLPEVQLSRAMFYLAVAFINPAFQDVCSQQITQQDLDTNPDNFMFTTRKEFFDNFEQLLSPLLMPICVLPKQDAPIEELFLNELARLSSGEIVTFANGLEVDGTKPLVRQQMSTLLTFVYGNNIGNTPIQGIFPGIDSCEKLFDFVHHGPTLEARSAALNMLYWDWDYFNRAYRNESCITTIIASQPNLEALAANGDIPAALMLIDQWIKATFPINNLSVQEKQFAAVSEIQRFELLLLTQTGTNSLLSLSAMLPMYILQALNPSLE